MKYNQLNFSIIGLILIVLSPSYDIIAVFTLIVPWVIIILNNMVIISKDLSTDEKNSLNNMSFVALIFLIVGMFTSHFQPIGFFQIIPFGYYIIISLLISLSLGTSFHIKYCNNMD